jgi:hypothetical protein
MKRLDFVVDDIVDHNSLDNKVYKSFRSNWDREPPPAISILEAVVNHSPDKLDQKFNNFGAAVDIVAKYSPLIPAASGDENSNLEQLLERCWRQGTFQKIRCLSEHSFMALFF